MTTEPRASLVEVDLLPCPFCGGEAEFVDGADDDGQWVAVGCPDCGAGSRQHYGVMEDPRPHAQNAWNTRLEALRTQGDGEGWSEAIAGLDMQALASVIHDARWDQGRDASTWVPMDEDYQSGKVYCMRIANAVQMHLLASPTQASSREEVE